MKCTTALVDLRRPFARRFVTRLFPAHAKLIFDLRTPFAHLFIGDSASLVKGIDSVEQLLQHGRALIRASDESDVDAETYVLLGPELNSRLQDAVREQALLDLPAVGCA